MTIKQRLGALLTATLLGGVIGAVALVAPAHAAQWGPYRIIHIPSGLCLEVPNSSTADGVELRLGVCGPPSGSWNQKFVFGDSAFNWSYFLQPAHDGHCVVPGADIDNTSIVQWGCNWGDWHDVWFMEFPFGVNHPEHVERVFRNANSGLCMYAYGSVGEVVRTNNPFPGCGTGIGGSAYYWKVVT